MRSPGRQPGSRTARLCHAHADRRTASCVQHRSLGWDSGSGQRLDRYRAICHHLRLADLRHPQARARCHHRGHPAPTGCGGVWQNRDDRIRLAQKRAHGQPLSRGTHARRLLQWLGSGRGHRHGAPGFGHPDLRLSHPPGGLLRRGGLQSQLRRGATPGRVPGLRGAGPCRFSGPLRQRCGPRL